ncbi:MAG: hypothetical protein J2P39_00145 [Candidatus Dormibacteraeota bacterium]|nr:hypothetical protein [Candidatus Dormibacteraeota bacterium]
MTLEEVQARREELWEVVRRYGVDRLTVVVSEPEARLPYDYDLYFEVGFTPEAKAETRGLAYVSALADMAEELSDVLGGKASVGEMGQNAGIHIALPSIRERGVPL